MRISDWSSDVCSSDLGAAVAAVLDHYRHRDFRILRRRVADEPRLVAQVQRQQVRVGADVALAADPLRGAGLAGHAIGRADRGGAAGAARVVHRAYHAVLDRPDMAEVVGRSEEHTSELQSLMRISYAVFCLKKKNK